MMRNILKCGMVFSVLGALSACGTYTPDIMEAWGQKGDEQIIVNSIAQRIRCEISEAVNTVLDDDLRDARQFKGQTRLLEWLEKWGAQVTLTLSIDEKTNVNPGVVFNTPMIGAKTWFPAGISVPASQFYTLGLGGKFNSTASRIDKINWFYTVAELRKDRACTMDPIPGSYLIVDSDLKLKDWLRAAVTPSQTDLVTFPTDPNKKDVISHQVKFVIETGGDITPTWRLVRITANGAGSFFGATRSRTQDLTITLGPTKGEPVPVKQVAGKTVVKEMLVPTTAAQNAHLASQIGLSVANNLLNISP
ncbi:hypothetical protein [Methylocystis sp. S23]|jgi:hypothetical protein